MTRVAVIAGLDPRIHHSSQKHFFETDGLPGQGSAMTVQVLYAAVPIGTFELFAG
jgi:hypothetical protein